MLVTHIKSILRNKVNGIYIILSTIFFHSAKFRHKYSIFFRDILWYKS